MRTIRPNDPVTTEVLHLVEGAGIREACEFDLLLFFSRHPRVVLSREQLATYVGHEVQPVARALDRMLEAGVLRRVPGAGAARGMYVLAEDEVAEWLEPVRRLCAMPDGRHALRTLLRERRPQMQPKNGSTEHA